MTIAGSIEDLFKQLIAAKDFVPTLEIFYELCKRLNVSPTDHATIYTTFRDNLQNTASHLWKSLDKRRTNSEYGDGTVCKGVNVLIIGAGPCGLRSAIECALLGAKTVLVEARQYFSRNNILHLWPFVIQDIKMLGGKAIFPKFCTGALDHVSIKRMQLILLKIALVLGVEVHAPVRYEGVHEPDPMSGSGWRAKLKPAHCPAGRFDYDVVVGALGKAASAPFPDFSRKVLRGKLAIAVTANFVNSNSQDELKIREIGGLFFIFDQEFFNNLKVKCGVELENFVYYKDDTHYFVMTVKKKSLLSKGVLKQDYADARQLLSPANRNKDKLHEFAKEIAMATTQHQLPGLQYELNHHGEEDVAMFDFTSMSMANHSCYVKKRHGKTLMQCIVGDSLIEPFWPTGSGCARGFLSCLDAAWLIRCWHMKELPELHVIAEREQIFQILSQTKPDNLAKAHSKYTIDPHTRYGTRLKTKTIVSFDKIRHLIDAGEGEMTTMAVDETPAQHKPKQRLSMPSRRLPRLDVAEDRRRSEMPPPVVDNKRKTRLRGGSLDTHRLLSWFQTTLKPYGNAVIIRDLNESWRDGFGLCALVHVYRPNVCDFHTCQSTDKNTRVQIALTLIEQEFGVEAMLSVDDICGTGPVDKLAMLSYLAQLHEAIQQEPPSKMIKLASNKPVLERGTAFSLTPPRSESPQQHGMDSSPSAKAMLKHLTSSMALKSMERAADRTQAWLSGATDFNVSMDINQDVMDAVLKSTRTPSKLSRKKVIFKKTPPAVVKYRQSQVDIGQDTEIIGREDTASPRGLTKGRPSIMLCRGIAGNRLRAIERQESPPTVLEEEPSTVMEEEPEVDAKDQQKHGKDERRSLSQVPAWLLQSDSRAACLGKAQQHIKELHRVEAIQQDSSGRVLPRQPPQRPAPVPSGDASRNRAVAQRSASPVTSDLCCVCRKALLLVERYTAHGVFFHRKCFCCDTCSTALHVGTSVFQRKEDRACFYCYAHAYIAGAIDVQFSGGAVSQRSDTDPSLRNQRQEAMSNPVYAATSVRGQTDNISDYSSSSSDYSDSESDDDDDDEQQQQPSLSLIGSEEDDVLTQLSTSTLPRNAKPHTLKRALRSQNSLRLLAADEIQRGLDDVENQEIELEEKGQVVEKMLRSNPDDTEQDEGLMDEWLGVLRKKKELVDKEAKLMLKAKLMELQERHNRLQLSLKMAGMDDDMSSMVTQLEEDTVELEDEMGCLVQQMASLSTYLARDSTA